MRPAPHGRSPGRGGESGSYANAQQVMICRYSTAMAQFFNKVLSLVVGEDEILGHAGAMPIDVFPCLPHTARQPYFGRGGGPGIGGLEWKEPPRSGYV